VLGFFGEGLSLLRTSLIPQIAPIKISREKESPVLGMSSNLFWTEAR